MQAASHYKQTIRQQPLPLLHSRAEPWKQSRQKIFHPQRCFTPLSSAALGIQKMVAP